jgi:hypothetical protein
MSKRSVVAFEDTLVNAIAYFRKEWHITNAEVIGVIEIVIEIVKQGMILDDLDNNEAGN